MSQPIASLEGIADLAAIGAPGNPIDRNVLLQRAGTERLPPAADDSVRSLLLLVDPQMDFMENGSLGVPGSHADMARTIRFIHERMGAITQVWVSLDTHDPRQIFHPAWWVDRNGQPAPAFTTIKAEDVLAGRWLPTEAPEESLRYLQELERQSRKALVVWPYHCLQGTTGAAMENQLANIVYYHAVARRSPARLITKGRERLSERYGIFRPEVGAAAAQDIALLDALAGFDRVWVAGQAKSHCVPETVGRILAH